MLDEDDYYGCNFSGKNQILQIGYQGADHFPAIPFEESQKEIIDQLPVYYFDLSADNDEISTEGNFKTFMTTYWTEILNKIKLHTKSSENKQILKSIQRAITDLDPFSDVLLSSEPFQMSNVVI